jgi:LmbE family N-acetylglucosaminyl deacetylase
MSRSSKRRAPRVLVIAPHPDDEALATGGVIQEHLRKGHVVKVLLVTCGDGQRRGLLLPPRHFLRLGERRYRESLDALRTLGVHEKRVIALGYPDRGLAHLSESPYRSRYTKVCAVPYEWAYRPGAPYTREALLIDLAEIFTDERPQLIYLPPSAGSPRRSPGGLSLRACGGARAWACSSAAALSHPLWGMAAPSGEMLRQALGAPALPERSYSLARA